MVRDCLQVMAHILIDLHNGGFVGTAVAVVRSREDSDYISLMDPVIALRDEIGLQS